MDNNVLELILEINFCPYCGSSDIERDRTEESCTCNECCKDFIVLSHE